MSSKTESLADAELAAITQRDQQWLRLVWKGVGADKILEDAYNAAGNDRRTLLVEVDRLRHDLERSMANHIADINTVETAAPLAALRDAAQNFHAAYCSSCPDNPCSLGIELHCPSETHEELTIKFSRAWAPYLQVVIFGAVGDTDGDCRWHLNELAKFLGRASEKSSVDETPHEV